VIRYGRQMTIRQKFLTLSSQVEGLEQKVTGSKMSTTSDDSLFAYRVALPKSTSLTSPGWGSLNSFTSSRFDLCLWIWCSLCYRPMCGRQYMNQQPISDYSGSPFCTTTLQNHANRIIKLVQLSHWVAEYNLKVSSA